MPRFFNRIRKQLAKENKFFQYSRYAVGEILLVVIGILIALQIDNWNEVRKDREEETQLLLSLKNEFIRNIFELHGIKNEHDAVLEACIRALKSFDDSGLNNVPQSVLSDIAWAAIEVPVYRPINNATNSIVSSGKLELIENQELKKFLNQWEFYCRRYGENALLSPQKITGELITQIKGVIPVRNLAYVHPVRPNDNLPYSKSAYLSNDILKDFELENLLELKRMAMTKLYSDLIWIEKIQADILKILNEDLNKRNIKNEAGSEINDLRVTGSAIDREGFNSLTNDVPMKLIESKSDTWVIDLKLKPGWIVFKNRESWYDFWVIGDYPKGNLISKDNVPQSEMMEQVFNQIINESGPYRIKVSTKDMKFSFEKLDD